MNYIQALNISKSVADKTLFENIDISINKGQKVALIAKNGTGKSSMIDILAGLQNPESGTVKVSKDIKIGYLHQQPHFVPEENVLDTIYGGDNEDLDLLKSYELALLKNEAEQIEKLGREIDTKNLWNLESKIKQILGKLDIYDFEIKMKVLSGGQVKRVTLARELIKDPNLLILDEPTNHLDIKMIEWLENYIQKNVDALFVVTHDRYFLDNITNEILELEGGVIHKYQGNYNYFLQKKAEREEIEANTVYKLKKQLKKELEWMRRTPSARGTKAKARITNFYDIKDKAKNKHKDDDVKMDMTGTYIGKKVMEIQDICKSYGEKKLIENFTYIFNRYDRIGIVGDNGSGKSTFLNIITENMKPDLGKIVVGKTINFGFFKQGTESLNEEKKVIETVQEVAEYIRLANGKDKSAAQMLEWFQFDRNKQYQYVKTLSGGEKRRLYLLTVLMKNPNFLILDEPTNDLDLQTLNTLEEFLEEYVGVLVMVSHDRYFMDKLIDHLFVFEGDGKVRDFPGNYTNYRIAISQEKSVTKKTSEKKEVVKKEKPKTKLSYNEKREFELLEVEIEQLENQKIEFETILNSGITNFEKLQETSEKLGKIVASLNTKSDRWLVLSEFV